MNLYEAIKDRRVLLPEKKCKLWMYQILKALDHMHRNGIFHRDIKPENILISDDNVKLADLGSCKGIYSKPPFTEYISTRWYRSPECLLTDGYYNYKMDIWGLGCVFFEILTLFPLFPGDDEIDQVNKIHTIIGSPPQELFDKLIKKSSRSDIHYEQKKGVGIKRFLNRVSDNCVDLITKMLIYDPDKRYTASQCLSHPYFSDLVAKEDHISKMSLVNFRRNPLLLMSFNNGTNDSISFAKVDDNSNLNTIRKIEKDTKSFLPEIRIHNMVSQNVVSSEKNILEDTASLENTKRNLITFVHLPKIVADPHKKKQWKEKGNYFNSNEFKLSVKHNMSNQSIDNIKGITHYDKKSINIRKRVSQVKKNYVSPYSKKNIMNNIQI